MMGDFGFMTCADCETGVTCDDNQKCAKQLEPCVFEARPEIVQLREQRATKDAELTSLRLQLQQTQDALRETRRELAYCVCQLRGHNDPVPESSVDRALKAADAALSAHPLDKE